jgi:urease accessory protein UreF
MASCLTTPNRLAAACSMKFTTIAVLLLSILVVGVASRQLLDADMDTALEHQRILAELEEVHQLRERMLQQGRAFCASVGHMPVAALLIFVCRLLCVNTTLLAWMYHRMLLPGLSHRPSRTQVI